jgi:thiosulfate/3-mercaptopyruvate sulfurtransferase
MPKQSPLVDAATLTTQLAAEDPPVILDIRWSLARPDDGPGDYRAGHLPGARYVSLEHDLSGRPDPAQGRHPLPDPADLQAALRRAGVRAGHAVVVYDATGSLAAARAWWLLRWAGHDAVQVLDGGLAAWTAAGGALETGEPPATGPGKGEEIVVRPGQMPTVSADEVAKRPHGQLLVDSRAAERYLGEVEPIDPVAGHIPGAVNLPTTDNLDAAGRFLPPAALKERFSLLQTQNEEGQKAIIYCGSGVTAAHQLLAMELAGVSGTLYPPSWSGWVSDPARPVATGKEG